jgi:predicted O-methyltransferase YrrM
MSALDAIKSGRALRVAISRGADETRERVWEPLNHWFGMPNVPQMTGGRVVSADPTEFVATLLPEADIAALSAEHDQVQEDLASRRASIDLIYGDSFAIEKGTSFFLYAVTRTQKPDHVLETGIADGVSSYVLLAAMDRNGKGTLHSTDIRPNAGELVGSSARWDRFILDRRQPAKSITAYVRGLPELDLFMHDSLHRRSWHQRELALAYSRLRAGGILASDDVNSSFAYSDFCAAHDLEPKFLFDQRKFVGAAFKPR